MRGPIRDPRRSQALAARPIGEEKNLVTLVMEILEAAAKGRPGTAGR